jgi:hypothetical protein
LCKQIAADINDGKAIGLVEEQNLVPVPLATEV